VSRMSETAFAGKGRFVKMAWRSIVRILLGGVAVSVVSLFASPFKVYRGAVALVYLTIVAGVSLTGDLVASGAIAVGAALCLRYFFAPPFSGVRIDKPLDTAALITFLALAVVVTRLISKMQRLNQELRRREAYLAEAQRLSHTGSFGWKLPTGELHWSEETFRIYEYDPTTKLTAELARERVHPEDAAMVKQVTERASQEGKDFDFEHRLLMPDGSVKHVHVVARAMSDESRGIEFVGAVTDTTATKRAEEALRRSENYLAEAQRIAHMGSWAWRVAGKQAFYLSEEWYRIYGFDPEDGIPSWEERLERVHPEDRARWQATLDDATREKADYETEFRLLLPDGSIKHIYTVGHTVFNASGDLIEFIGSSTDITERKRAEEALRRSEAYLAEAQRLTHIGSWACNILTGELLHSSEEHTRLYGFDPERGIPLFQELVERIHPEDRARVNQAFESASRAGIDIDTHFRIVAPNSPTKYVYATGHPVFNLSGTVSEFVGIVMDVTERMRADQERERLHQAQADLAHINRVTTMGELTASLAHEVNQPIAAAVTNANTCLRWLTRDHPDVQEARAAATRIVKDGTRAAEIVKRIRLLFKKETPEHELVDVNEVIRDMIALLRGEAMRYSIVVRTQLDERSPRVMGDRVQLQQVLMNLMLNAIEAMKESNETRELTVQSRCAENDQVLLSVSDTGVGLPAQQEERIFEAFFTTKSNGTGMGLSISRSIIEGHGGRLWAASNSGRGATFYVTLPNASEETG
jgi:PAS domain S-box-containing protein